MAKRSKLEKMIDKAEKERNDPRSHIVKSMRMGYMFDFVDKANEYLLGRFRQKTSNLIQAFSITRPFLPSHLRNSFDFRNFPHLHFRHYGCIYYSKRNTHQVKLANFLDKTKITPSKGRYLELCIWF